VRRAADWIRAQNDRSRCGPQGRACPARATAAPRQDCSGYRGRRASRQCVDAAHPSSTIQSRYRGVRGGAHRDCRARLAPWCCATPASGVLQSSIKLYSLMRLKPADGTADRRVVHAKMLANLLHHIRAAQKCPRHRLASVTARGHMVEPTDNSMRRGLNIRQASATYA
jgi:hypothetical protein